MPRITKISEQKRRANRRNIYLDGAFAFGCNVNVVARFRLREGMELSDERVREIQLGEVKQECFDGAIRLLESRLHSSSELRRKLMRKEWGEQVVQAVMDDLTRMGYLDDERFAKAKALSAAQHKHHGPRRAMVELLRAGVKREVASQACDDVYGNADNISAARQLAEKQANRLKKLDPLVARRRLVGMLQRRGFEYDTIKPVVDQVLGDCESY
ncbi:MAG TPA: RecX family transcriptional regulator [Tepidisphaeraceae bacterium]|jgi:regulatory protein